LIERPKGRAGMFIAMQQTQKSALGTFRSGSIQSGTYGGR